MLQLPPSIYPGFAEVSEPEIYNLPFNKGFYSRMSVVLMSHE
jgi:hypothetical protein